MSVEDKEPPQYIVTAPGDENYDDEDDRSSTTTTASTATTVNSAKGSSTTVNITKNKAHNTRSHSLQSSTASSASFLDQSSLSTATLMQQLKAQSSVNIVTEKHVQKFTSTTTTSSQTTSGVTKGKFTSFLQHPDPTATPHGATFLTAQQSRHARQFVRSTSAHSSTDGGSSSIVASGKSDKCIRSTSQQMDDSFDQTITIEQAKGFHQSSSILISKSAETIEGLKHSGSMRTQLTLSGGLLAPPNRKLTILSPVHAPPGLQELLKKHRSPLSPRISFPGAEADLFP